MRDLGCFLVDEIERDEGSWGRGVEKKVFLRS